MIYRSLLHTTGVSPLPDVTWHITSVKLLQVVHIDTGFHTMWLMASSTHWT